MLKGDVVFAQPAERGSMLEIMRNRRNTASSRVASRGCVFPANLMKFWRSSNGRGCLRGDFRDRRDIGAQAKFELSKPLLPMWFEPAPVRTTPALSPSNLLAFVMTTRPGSSGRQLTRYIHGSGLGWRSGIP